MSIFPPGFPEAGMPVPLTDQEGKNACGYAPFCVLGLHNRPYFGTRPSVHKGLFYKSCVKSPPCFDLHGKAGAREAVAF